MGDFDVAVTGPRRNLMRASKLNTYYPAPFGDMMITGCFGLLAAVADLLPEAAGPVRASLSGAGGSGTPPGTLDLTRDQVHSAGLERGCHLAALLQSHLTRRCTGN